jgi:hypothetical protein
VIQNKTLFSLFVSGGEAVIMILLDVWLVRGDVVMRRFSERGGGRG